MTVGINKITESNWKDFYVRVIHAQRARGNESYGITAQDVYNHIGLCTNAQTKTKRQFLDNIFNVLEINTKKYEISGGKTYLMNSKKAKVLRKSLRAGG